MKTRAKRASSPLTLIGASAGSGKTTRLTKVVTEAVDPTSADAIDLEGLVAVTYTRKGAAELGARIRRQFVEKGEYERAQRLPLAYIGTVHAVCLRLVKEFAIDAGLSPLVDVMPGGEARLLREALEEGLPPDLRKRIDALASGLELRFNQMTRRADWLTPVQDIMTLARSNRVSPADLPPMAERSVERLLELLGPREADGQALDRALEKALADAAKALGDVDDGTKVTRDARRDIQDALKAAQRRELKWSTWVRLQKLKPGKAATHLVAPMNAVAARVDGHPVLQDELAALTRAMYEAARYGLDAYDGWKKRRRVVDFVDMIDRALTLTEHQDVQDELRRRLELLVVDEFQDTSPVQLALFVRLHQVAGRSTWVGDRKQCIFEYAGADPALMEAVTGWARDSGGAIEQLPNNWRSRPELVDLFSTLFSSAMARHGYAPDEVTTSAKRKTPRTLAGLPPLGVWLLEANNQAQQAIAVAEGVRRLLEDPAATPVVDRATDTVRDLEAGDIAVLVATNAEAEHLANALAERGVRAAIARAGLLATPEGTLVSAALRRLLDAGDTLALAEIDALTGFEGMAPEAWLDRLILAQSERRAARDRGEAIEPPPLSAYPARLEPLRSEIDALAPTEAVDRVIAALDITTLCARWPNPEQRLSNLDALRALTAAYEERCTQHREAATLAGLIRFLDEAARPVLIRDEEIASDDQHVSHGRHSVTIATYHRAKGLEWPVVVLGSLDRQARRDAFEVCPETDRATFDANDPLGGRWIRYWPWPYGAQQKSRLDEAVAASPEGVAVAEREERERVRLLYVGFTRARDHLVLAARLQKTGPKIPWLDELADEQGTPLVTLPVAADKSGQAKVSIRGLRGATTEVPARCWSLSGQAESTPVSETESHQWFVPPAAATRARPGYWIAPSRAGTEWAALTVPAVGEPESTGPRLPLGSSKGIDWDVVGNSLHAFLAADARELDRAQRLERAHRLLGAANLLGLLAPESLVQAGDNLRQWVDAQWPDATWHHEVPITASIATAEGSRRIQGTIDLLLETPDGVVIIDHKTYPGAQTTWTKKALEFAPQLAAYAEALRLAGKTVLGAWVSFAVGGGVVRLS